MSAEDEMVYEDDPPHPRYSYHRSGGRFDGTIKSIGTALITAAILGFVGMCFAWNGAISNLRETQAVQAASISFLRDQLAEVKGDVNQMRGHVLRSDGSVNPDYFDADERKSK